jgi:K+-sensing histidine kinase KdpD
LARPDYWLRLNPWSLRALLVAIAGLAVAVGLRMALAALGLPLYFSTFIPVILVISLLAGVPAGTFTALSAVVIVWWAFMPPVFEFSTLDKEDIDRFQLFLLGVSVVIWFSHLCRAIARMKDQRPA